MYYIISSCLKIVYLYLYILSLKYIFFKFNIMLECTRFCFMLYNFIWCDVLLCGFIVYITVLYTYFCYNIKLYDDIFL